MKVAYWPGCVSRGFTPELHGSMAQVAPLLDIELVELDRASCRGAGVSAEHPYELGHDLALAELNDARERALAGRVLDDREMTVGERRDLRQVSDAQQLARLAQPAQPRAE